MISYLLAFLAPMVAINREQKEKPLPKFERAWWHNPNKLDARPVIWSLYNRPDEWSYGHSEYTIVHKPSNHTFWAETFAPFRNPYLYDARCSCNRSRTENKFQRFQGSATKQAMRWWKKWERCRSMKTREVDQEHFVGHFVRPDAQS